jgi:hypothetical protein
MISDAYTRCDLNDWAASGFLSDFPFASAFSVDGKYVAFLEKWSDAEKFGDLVVRSISNQTEVFRQRGVNQFLWLPNTSGLVYVIGYPATSDHVSENGGFLKRF